VKEQNTQNNLTLQEMFQNCFVSLKLELLVLSFLHFSCLHQAFLTIAPHKLPSVWK